MEGQRLKSMATERGREGGSIIAASRLDAGRQLTPGIILPSMSLMMASHGSGVMGASLGNNDLK